MGPAGAQKIRANPLLSPLLAVSQARNLLDRSNRSYRVSLRPSPGNAGRQPIYGPSLWAQRLRRWLDDLSAGLIENSTVSAGGGA